MTRETLTPKERWLAVLRRETPDRLPMDYWGTGEATQNLMDYLHVNTVWEAYDALHIDGVVTVGPAYAGPPLAPGTDMYGCRIQTVDYGAGLYEETTYHPLAAYSTVEEIDAAYTWPAADWFDYTVIPDQVRERGDTHPIRGGGSEPFLTYCRLRGLEQAYMDLVDHPDIVAYCLDQLFDFCYENTVRIYEQLPGKVNITYVAEDFGSQESMLISPRLIRKIFIPRMKRMIDLAHSAGAYVFFHSDGAVRPIIPDMIAAGINVLNPIQWRCVGMEREGLKRDFGDQLIFHGAVDNQQTLPFGTVEDVRREVIENIAILGADSGYIIAPCHNIQPITPPENVVALYETGYASAWR